MKVGDLVLCRLVGVVDEPVILLKSQEDPDCETIWWNIFHTNNETKNFRSDWVSQWTLKKL